MTNDELIARAEDALRANDFFDPLLAKLIAALRASEARVKVLEEALSPFADAADEMDDDDADDNQKAPISAGDCREARAVLKGGTQ